jgi:hypothetical protein
MSIEIDDAKLAAGAYCRSKVSGCFCAVGWPYERQCPDCRDTWPEGARRDSYCICPPDEGEEPSPTEIAYQRGRQAARLEVQAWLRERLVAAGQRPEDYEGERWGLATVSDELARYWREVKP